MELTKLSKEELLYRYEILLERDGYSAKELDEVRELRAELLRRLSGSGAAVSASPRPRCPNCKSVDVTVHYHAKKTPHLECRNCDLQYYGSEIEFFADAPAQEPNYNRAYTILGEALQLKPEYYGLVEMAQVAANRLTGKYDSLPSRCQCRHCHKNKEDHTLVNGLLVCSINGAFNTPLITFEEAAEDYANCCDFTGEHWLGCPNIGKGSAQEQPVDSLPASPGPRPVCPKCQSLKVNRVYAFDGAAVSMKEVTDFCGCRSCNYDGPVAQFFPASLNGEKRAPEFATPIEVETVILRAVDKCNPSTDGERFCLYNIIETAIKEATTQGTPEGK